MDEPFSLRFTLLLLVILIVPFCFRVLSPELEPYPAIILPSGASEIPVEDSSFTYLAQEIWALDQDHQWKKVDPTQFLEPIPTHFLYGIIENDFGLNDLSRTVEFRFDLLDERSISSKHFSAEEKKATTDWIQDRLISLGYAPSSIRIKTVERTIDKRSGQIVDETTLNDERFNFDS